jgi:hypothetical protein
LRIHVAISEAAGRRPHLNTDVLLGTIEICAALSAVMRISCQLGPALGFLERKSTATGFQPRRM